MSKCFLEKNTVYLSSVELAKRVENIMLVLIDWPLYLFVLLCSAKAVFSMQLSHTV